MIANGTKQTSEKKGYCLLLNRHHLSTAPSKARSKKETGILAVCRLPPAVAAAGDIQQRNNGPRIRSE